MESNDIVYLFINVTGPLSIYASVVCGIAVLTYYIFPKQRKFPNTVLVWTCMADLVCCIYLAIKWTDGPIKLFHANQIVPGSLLCRFTMYVEIGLEIASSVACVIVAFTLYSAIVKNVDFKSFTSRYYKWFMISLWGGSCLYPLISLIDINSPTQQGHGICTLDSSFGIAILLVPWAVMLLIQVVLIALIFRFIFNINNVFRVHSTGAKGLLWLYTRFFVMLFNQIALWLNVNIFELCSIYGLPITKFHIMALALGPIFISINGIIVIANNTSLQQIALQMLDKCKNKSINKWTIPFLKEAQSEPNLAVVVVTP